MATRRTIIPIFCEVCRRESAAESATVINDTIQSTVMRVFLPFFISKHGIVCSFEHAVELDRAEQMVQALPRDYLRVGEAWVPACA